MTTQSKVNEDSQPATMTGPATVLVPAALWLIVPLTAMLLYPLVRENEQYLTWLTGALVICVLIFSVVVHEVCHGLAAFLCGDPTAHDAGRFTLNPISHISAFGSIVVPLLLHLTGAGLIIGWAKPVPFNPLRLRHYPRDQVALALAGPTSNLLLSFASFTLFLALGALFNHLYPEKPVSLQFAFPPTVAVGDVALAGAWFVVFQILAAGMFINSSLAVFNLVP
ncbi:MAG: hypothetical protein GF331_12455, partial [Chitinivibrionales bacterium]|nr:hypothetical protein [Chitinivibrionales bacterium]